MNLFARWLALALAAMSAATAQATPPPAALEAEFELLRNGKTIGELSIYLKFDGDRWEMGSDSRGTRGMARFLGFEESSVSKGAWTDNGPRPELFEQKIKVAVKKIHNRAEFDWEAGTVHSVHEDGESTLNLEPGVVDPVSIGLVMRAGLSKEESEWQLKMVDEDEIESAHFRLHEQHDLQTVLGCLNVAEVHKIRAPESDRYTRTFYARDLAWAPVLVQHGKTGSEAMETRIRSLKIEGESVPVSPDCPAPPENAPS